MTRDDRRPKALLQAGHGRGCATRGLSRTRDATPSSLRARKRAPPSSRIERSLRTSRSRLSLGMSSARRVAVASAGHSSRIAISLSPARVHSSRRGRRPQPSEGVTRRLVDAGPWRAPGSAYRGRIEASTGLSADCESIQRIHISPAIGKRRVDSVTRPDVERLARSMLERGLAPNTRAQRHDLSCTPSLLSLRRANGRSATLWLAQPAPAAAGR